jgi:hypothetical protein
MSERAKTVALVVATLSLAALVVQIPDQYSGQRAEEVCSDETLGGALVAPFSWGRLGVRCEYGDPPQRTTARTDSTILLMLLVGVWILAATWRVFMFVRRARRRAIREPSF